MPPLGTLTLLDEDSPLQVPAVVDADGVRLSPDVVQRSLGWRLEAAGLCRGDTCLPVRPEHGLLRHDGLDLRALASLLDRPLALDVDERGVRRARGLDPRSRVVRRAVEGDRHDSEP